LHVVCKCRDSGMLDKGILRCTLNTSTGQITSRGVCKLDRQFHRKRVREADSSNFGLNGLTAEAFRVLCMVSLHIKLTNSLRPVKKI